MLPPVLSMCDLQVGFHTPRGFARAVDGVTLELHPKKTLALVGESGCGKSVTALSILRLIDDAHVAGRVLFGREDLLRIPEARMRPIRGGKIAMIFQEPATSLHPMRTIGAQIAESLWLHRGLRGRSARQEVVRLLGETRIPDPRRRARQYPHELSGGMKQRAMIAMALAGEPDLLIADEPTTALDVTVQADILRLLRRLQTERQLAVLLITHDLGVVAEIADEVAVMYAGRIVERAPAEDLFADPKHPYTIGLLKSLPRLDVDAAPTPIHGTVPLPTQWPAGCRFRPRCSVSVDRCHADPPLAPLSGDASHASACWLHQIG